MFIGLGFGLIELILLMLFGGGGGILLGMLFVLEDVMMFWVVFVELFYYGIWFGMVKFVVNSENVIERFLVGFEFCVFMVKVDFDFFCVIELVLW